MDLSTLASWPSAEWTFSFSPATRRRLIDANKGFDAESRLAELAFWVTIELETEWVPAKRRRAELADLVQAAEQPAAALVTLHAENRHALLLTAYRAGKTGMWFRQVEQDLGVFHPLPATRRTASRRAADARPSWSVRALSAGRAVGSSACPRFPIATLCRSPSRAMPRRTASTFRSWRQKMTLSSAAWNLSRLS